MLRTAVLAAAAVLLPVQALAQAEGAASRLSFAEAAPAVAAQASRAVPMRGYFWKFHAGARLRDEAEGVYFGAGVGFLPASNKQHEAEGRGSFLRVEGYNGFTVEGNYLYSFNTSTSFTPYALAGLEFSRLDLSCSRCDDSDTVFQIGGGIRKPLASEGAIGGRLTIKFTERDATFALEFTYER